MRVTDPLLLGIDVGTTFCKAALVTLQGKEISHAKRPTPWDRVPTGGEIDPAVLFDAALHAATEALGWAGRPRVAAIGVTSLAETGVLLDGNGDPVAPAVAWFDTRGEDEVAELGRDFQPRGFAVSTGLPIHPRCSAVKYLWLKRNHPDAIRGRRWLNVAEWVVRRLGGRELAELSLSSRTGWLHRPSARPWGEALEWSGAPDGLLPEPALAGTPAGQAARGLLPGCDDAVLTIAGHDHLCAVVGAGATHEGDLFDSCGTAEAFVRAVDPSIADETVARAVESGVTVGWHVLPRRQLLLAGFKSGMAMARVLSLLGVPPDGHGDLDVAALATPSGAWGMSIYEVTRPDATITGIPWDATPALLWRATLEAVAQHGKSMLAKIVDLGGPTKRLVVAGGWAANPAFSTVKQEIVGSFYRPQVGEAGVRGAALIGGCAAELFAGVDDVPAPVFQKVG